MPTTADELVLARQRHQAGDLSGAIELYSQIIASDPECVNALTWLGRAFQQQGNPTDAQRVYERALAIQSDDAELHFNSGMALATLGKLDEAVSHFREATRLRPDAPATWNNLGNALIQQGEPLEAIPCYRENVRLRPGNPAACLNLGHALREGGWLEEGLAWYREAVRLQPDHSQGQHSLAVALLEIGAIDEAETHLRESWRCNPGSAAVLYTLALHGLYTDADPTPEQLATRLAGPNLPPMEASQLHALLGQLLDRAGRYDDAFGHFRSANELRRDVARQVGTPFDGAEYGRAVDQVAAVFTPEYFQRVQGFGLETEVPVFIVGMPRSGSSLVEQILASHPEAAGVGELRDMPRLAAKLVKRLGVSEPYPACVAQLDGPTSRELAESYLQRARELAGPARRIADKMLENFLHLGFIATLFPRARVIHCRRGPLDTCVSCYLHTFPNLPYTWDLADLGAYFRIYDRLMAHWRAVLPLPMLDIAYEELVSDPERIVRELLDFCGLAWDERCLRYYESARPVRTVSKQQVRQPIYQSSVGRWCRYSANLGPLRAALGLDGISE